jgi:hypothetical protein
MGLARNWSKTVVRTTLLVGGFLIARALLQGGGDAAPDAQPGTGDAGQVAGQVAGSEPVAAPADGAPEGAVAVPPRSGRTTLWVILGLGGAGGLAFEIMRRQRAPVEQPAPAPRTSRSVARMADAAEAPVVVQPPPVVEAAPVVVQPPPVLEAAPVPAVVQPPPPVAPEPVPMVELDFDEAAAAEPAPVPPEPAPPAAQPVPPQPVAPPAAAAPEKPAARPVRRGKAPEIRERVRGTGVVTETQRIKAHVDWGASGRAKPSDD